MVGIRSYVCTGAELVIYMVTADVHTNFGLRALVLNFYGHCSIPKWRTGGRRTTTSNDDVHREGDQSNHRNQQQQHLFTVASHNDNFRVEVNERLDKSLLQNVAIAFGRCRSRQTNQ